jgi:repressor LexA
VRGDSMIDDGILDGDFAIIQSGSTVADGAIGAAVVDGEATLKHVHIYPDRVELVPANSAYKTQVYSRANASSVEIIGSLSFVIRTF